MVLTHLARDEFVNDYFDYRPGQHVAFIEPTGGGKTRLKYQLLRQAMRQQPQLEIRATIPKRRDAEASAWNAALGLRKGTRLAATPEKAVGIQAAGLRDMAPALSRAARR